MWPFLCICCQISVRQNFSFRHLDKSLGYLRTGSHRSLRYRLLWKWTALLCRCSRFLSWLSGSLLTEILSFWIGSKCFLHSISFSFTFKKPVSPFLLPRGIPSRITLKFSKKFPFLGSYIYGNKNCSSSG